MADRVWRVFQYDFERRWPDVPAKLSGDRPDLATWARESGMRHRQRFLIAPTGFPDLRVNAYLASPRIRSLAETTQRDYAYSLALWLNFLDATDQVWWEAGEDDAEEFKFWRLTDPENEQPVGTSTFSKDLAACKKFYTWTSERYPVVADPFAQISSPIAKRGADVKWLDPAAVVRWRDLGLRGRLPSGRRDRSWRGRNEQRDAAFVDGLYGTGLRLTEWASVVLPELPQLEVGRGYYRCELGDMCAKGGNGHSYWIPRAALAAVRAYTEGVRARVVREAQAAGRYERIPWIRVVAGEPSRVSVTVPDRVGGTATRPWALMRPGQRRALFRSTPSGLEPLWLWLNEDGMPRDPHGWHHTFEAANRRITGLGLDGFRCTPHMYRHSFALRWFSIGKLVRGHRMDHLSKDQTDDFREQFGDTWHLVQTMLGHKRVETTKDVYLEPFRRLEVEQLLAHSEGFPVARFMAEAFASHPRVRTDPLAGDS